MNNKFWTGFASGVAGGAMIFAVIFALYTTAVKGDGKVPESTSQSTQASASGTGILGDEAVQKKVKKLESLIDAYFIDNVEESDLKDGLYKGLLEGLDDPYSCYYTQDEYAQLMQSSSGIYTGIGATVSQNVKTGVITIVKPFAGGPAYNAGLLPGDILYKVDGEEVSGKDVTEVVSHTKGEEGTTVELEVLRGTSTVTVTITRAKIEVPTVEYEMLDNQIGYIYIMEFDEVTAPQFRSALDELDKQGMKGLVIDIRGNGGGLLESVSDMLDRMLPEGLIVYTEDKYGKRVEKNSTADEAFDKPLAVIINGYSASASEIFAGALQDYGLATIVGTQSFGKGIVQSVIPLYDNTAVKLTVSKYYTPKGRNIHGTGITPDVEIDLEEEQKKLLTVPKEEDGQLQKAIEIVESKVSEAK